MPRTRAEHLQWAKDRALEYADRGDVTNARTPRWRWKPSPAVTPAAGLVLLCAAPGTAPAPVTTTVRNPRGNA
jgi:hypothetical protein